MAWLPPGAAGTAAAAVCSLASLCLEPGPPRLRLEPALSTASAFLGLLATADEMPCMYARTHVVRVRMYACTHVLTYACTHVRMHVCVHV